MDGLTLGAMYALIALGYTLVYGVLRLINFAHSEIFMIGVFASLFAIHGLGIDDADPAKTGAVLDRHADCGDAGVDGRVGLRRAGDGAHRVPAAAKTRRAAPGGADHGHRHLAVPAGAVRGRATAATSSAIPRSPGQARAVQHRRRQRPHRQGLDPRGLARADGRARPVRRPVSGSAAASGPRRRTPRRRRSWASTSTGSSC